MPTTSCGFSPRCSRSRTSARRGADIQAGQVVVAAGETLNSSRIGALAAVGIRLGRRLRAAARRDSFDRQRSGRAGARAEARADLRHQPFHALGRRLGQRRHSDRVPAGARHARRARRDARRSRRLRHRRLLGWKLCRRARFDSRRDRGERQDAVSRRRREARQADRTRRRQGQARVCDAGLSHVVPVERAHAARADAAPHRAPSARKSARRVTLPLAARIASAAGRHQFYTVRIEGGAAVPAFKASGDITSMSRADGYIEIPANVDAVEAGTSVEVTLF